MDAPAFTDAWMVADGAAVLSESIPLLWQATPSATLLASDVCTRFREPGDALLIAGPTAIVLSVREPVAGTSSYQEAGGASEMLDYLPTYKDFKALPPLYSPTCSLAISSSSNSSRCRCSDGCRAETSPCTRSYAGALVPVQLCGVRC